MVPYLIKAESYSKRNLIKFNHQCKQDHQRWGYSTVTHLEQPVYLATWKDLNKEKRKEHRKKIEPYKWGGWSSVSYFLLALDLRT